MNALFLQISVIQLISGVGGEGPFLTLFFIVSE